MKKQFLTIALALTTVGAMAQEKVRVHNGDETYVTTIEYLTFDAADADSAISVSSLQDENAALNAENAALEGQVSALTGEKNTLAGQISTLTTEKTALTADTTALKKQVASLENDTTALNSKVSGLNADKAALEGQVTTLTSEKNTLAADTLRLYNQTVVLTAENGELVNDTVRLYDAVTTLNGQIASKNTQIAGLETDTTNLNAELRSLKSAYLQLATNGHAYVDLGLPSGTLWATCNIGATNPEDYGDYFAWGETETHYSAGGDTQTPTWKDGYSAGYNWSTYKYCEGSNTSMTKYCTSSSYGTVDNLTQLEDEDDVAIQQWGGNWRMPTDDQLKELRKNCYWVWTTTYNGKSVNGYIVYKKKSEGEYSVANDPHIFLPAAGLRYGDVLNNPGASGYYWSRSLRSSSSNSACYWYFNSSDVDWYDSGRCSGLSVRAVCPGAQK